MEKVNGGLEPRVTDAAARTNVRPGESLKMGFGISAHTCRWRVYSNAAVAARIADIGLDRSISADLNEHDWHNAVAANWDEPLILGHDGIRIDLSAAPQTCNQTPRLIVIPQYEGA